MSLKHRQTWCYFISTIKACVRLYFPKMATAVFPLLHAPSEPYFVFEQPSDLVEESKCKSAKTW